VRYDGGKELRRHGYALGLEPRRSDLYMKSDGTRCNVLLIYYELPLQINLKESQKIMACSCRLVLLASLWASAAGFSLTGGGLPGGLRVREMKPTDIFPASLLLVRAFSEPDGLNVVSQALIFAEHVVGLRERYRQNVIFVAEHSAVHRDELVGNVIPTAL